MNRLAAHRPSELSHRYEHSISISMSLKRGVLSPNAGSSRSSSALETLAFLGRSNLVETDSDHRERSPIEANRTKPEERLSDVA